MGMSPGRREVAVTARNYRIMEYRVPKERVSLTEAQRGAASLAAFKRGSRGRFLAGYGAFASGGTGQYGPAASFYCLENYFCDKWI